MNDFEFSKVNDFHILKFNYEYFIIIIISPLFNYLFQ